MHDHKKDFVDIYKDCVDSWREVKKISSKLRKHSSNDYLLNFSDLIEELYRNCYKFNKAKKDLVEIFEDFKLTNEGYMLDSWILMNIKSLKNSSNQVNGSPKIKLSSVRVLKNFKLVIDFDNHFGETIKSLGSDPIYKPISDSLVESKFKYVVFDYMKSLLPLVSLLIGLGKHYKVVSVQNKSFFVAGDRIKVFESKKLKSEMKEKIKSSFSKDIELRQDIAKYESFTPPRANERDKYRYLCLSCQVEKSTQFLVYSSLFHEIIDIKNIHGWVNKDRPQVYFEKRNKWQQLHYGKHSDFKGRRKRYASGEQKVWVWNKYFYSSGLEESDDFFQFNDNSTTIGSLNEGLKREGSSSDVSKGSGSLNS